MQYKIINAEVLVADEQIVKLTPDDMVELKTKLAHTLRKRVRICAHRTVEDKVHEMMIVLDKDTYVRVHKHLGKSESFHVIEGSADLFLFDDDGTIMEIIPIGDYASGRTFFFRIADPVYHTLTINSDVLVIHETTGGPFSRSDTLFAPWSPSDDDLEAISRFKARLRSLLEA